MPAPSHAHKTHAPTQWPTTRTCPCDLRTRPWVQGSHTDQNPPFASSNHQNPPFKKKTNHRIRRTRAKSTSPTQHRPGVRSVRVACIVRWTSRMTCAGGLSYVHASGHSLRAARQQASHRRVPRPRLRRLFTDGRVSNGVGVGTRAVGKLTRPGA